MVGVSFQPLFMPSGGGGGYTFVNSEAETLVASMSVQPDDTRKELIDDLVGGLKTDGIWTEIDILYVIAAHDSQAATLNWKAPASFALVAVNSPTFTTDRGYTGDGSSSRLRTQFTPSTNGVNYIQDDASAWVWVLTDIDEARADIGNITAPNLLIRSRSTTMRFECNDATLSQIANASSIGFFGTSRSVSTNKLAWKNGAQLTTTAIASTGVPSQEQWVCGANSTSFSTKQIAAAAWGSAIAGLEDEFYNRLLTYMQAVGAA